MDQDPKYMFRPIAEDGGQPVPTSANAMPTQNIRPVMSPTRPKLYSCWRRSEENWSSTGSRHSSRPGSSTASSSRPPSQPNGQVPPGLYCKSNNSSQSDVSVARNFQQLSVSSRRALFKTQKWSHSFDQTNLQVQAQMSPGRRRQVLGQQNKSLDLDSGYSGSWGMNNGIEPLPSNLTLPNLTQPLDPIKSESQDYFQQPSLPSFPESFTTNPDVNLIPAEPGLDTDLDEEIKMIVARAEHREGLLSFLEDHVDVEESAATNTDEDLLYVRPEPVRTRNPLLCQKSSSSSGYETCISSVSDNNVSMAEQPMAPPRTKRGATKKSKVSPSPISSAGKR